MAPGQRCRQMRLAAHLDPGDKTAGCDRRASSDGAPHQSLRDHERQAVLDEDPNNITQRARAPPTAAESQAS
jgi:hypothetical protein